MTTIRRKLFSLILIFSNVNLLRIVTESLYIYIICRTRWSSFHRHDQICTCNRLVNKAIEYRTVGCNHALMPKFLWCIDYSLRTVYVREWMGNYIPHKTTTLLIIPIPIYIIRSKQNRSPYHITMNGEYSALLRIVAADANIEFNSLSLGPILLRWININPKLDK